MTGVATDVVSIAEAADLLGVKRRPSTPTSAAVSCSASAWPATAAVGCPATTSCLSAAQGVRTLLHDEDLGRTAAGSTEVARILGDRLLYRDQDAVELARTVGYEEVCQLLWDRADAAPAARLDDDLRAEIRALVAAMPETSLPLDRLKVVAVLLGARDAFRYDLSTPSVLVAARTLAPAFVRR